MAIEVEGAAHWQSHWDTSELNPLLRWLLKFTTMEVEDGVLAVDDHSKFVTACVCAALCLRCHIVFALPTGKFGGGPA